MIHGVRRRRCTNVALLVCVACGRDPAPAPAPSPAAPPVQPTGPQVRLVVDDQPAGAIAVGASQPLASVVPAAPDPAAWVRVELDATGRRFLDLSHPAETYPGASFRIYVDDRGRPTFGVFREVQPGLPPEVERIARQPAPVLADITEIRIHTHEAAPAATASLTVEVAGQASSPITPADLAATPPLTAGRSKPRGWPLAQVLALRAPGAIARVVIEDREKHVIEIAGGDLAAATPTRVLRVNNRSLWVFEEWQGDQRVRNLRDVMRIRIEAAAP